MTLTDREIAILHLAIAVEADSSDGFDMNRFFVRRDEVEGMIAAETMPPACVADAMRFVPLYRHAFGIEAPEEARGASDAIRAMLADAPLNFQGEQDVSDYIASHPEAETELAAEAGQAAHPSQAPAKAWADAVGQCFMGAEPFDAVTRDLVIAHQAAVIPPAETELSAEALSGVVYAVDLSDTPDLPGEMTVEVNALGKVRLLSFVPPAPTCDETMRRFADALNALVKSGAVKFDVNGYMREDDEPTPSPASLAIASALSKTR